MTTTVRTIIINVNSTTGERDVKEIFEHDSIPTLNAVRAAKRYCARCMQDGMKVNILIEHIVDGEIERAFDKEWVVNTNYKG